MSSGVIPQLSLVMGPCAGEAWKVVGNIILMQQVRTSDG